MVLIFHNDGYFERTSVLYHSEINKSPKNSVHYGGKYRIIDNRIELEKFYPSRCSNTNYYSRNIQSGIIQGDRIIFDGGYSHFIVYEKNKSINDDQKTDLHTTPDSDFKLPEPYTKD